MHRIIVAILASIDAFVATAIGVVLALAPLTVLFATSLGADAPWQMLWPAAAAIWQLAHLVPLSFALDESQRAPLQIPEEAAGFTFSLAPLALAVFVVAFAWRSGVRSVQSGAGVTGWISGILVTAAFATIIALTSGGEELMSSTLWQAIVFPTALYAGGVIAGGVSNAWIYGDEGPIDRLRGWIDDFSTAWSEVITASVRGAAATIVALVGLASVAFLAAVALGAGTAVTLFERAQVDLAGVLVLGIAQLAYVPTAIAWTISWMAGPGFAAGTDSLVTLAGTDVGVMPGVPMFGLIPAGDVPLSFVLVLAPIAAGVIGGLIARGWLVHEWETSDAPELATDEPVAPRLVTALAIAVMSGGAAAVIAVASSGSIGPGRMSALGPEPGPVALAVGIEVFIGAAVVLIGTRKNAAADQRDREAELEPSLD